MLTDLFAKVHDDPVVLVRRRLSEQDLLPYFRTMHGPPSAATVIEGRLRVNLGSSNYLGLSGDRRLTRAAARATDQYGTSLNGSRFMNGTTPLHLRLEAAVADWLGEEDALVFPTGYTTNLGVISALVGTSDVAICDAGDHASILDGAALARGRMLPFGHNRTERLRSTLADASRGEGGALVVVDSVYSMRGDVADVAGTAQLCRQYGARLLVDEAHAIGTLGPGGRGVAALTGAAGEVDLRMGTFSKALAGSGGFVAGPAPVIEYLRLNARAYMFTAATPPAGIGAALAAVEIANSAEGEQRRGALAANARHLRAELTRVGFAVAEAPRLPDGTLVQTPILRVPTGDDSTAYRIWRLLYDAGVYVNVAVHPAVPKKQAQLRISVMASHTADHLEQVIEAFAAVRVAPEAELAPRPTAPAESVLASY